jgi:hypothetical protein
LLHVIRTAVREVEADGGAWRSVIDSLGPGLQSRLTPLSLRFESSLQAGNNAYSHEDRVEW